MTAEVLTEKEMDLIYEILTTNWIYDKMESSEQFKDRMLSIDIIIQKLDK